MPILQALEERRWQIGTVLISLGIIAFLVGLSGHNPLVLAWVIIRSAFGSSYSTAEVLVRATPVLLCALAVALPAWVGLLNIGGEGQFYVGAVGAAWAALFLPLNNPWLMIPAMIGAALVAGFVWAGIAAVLRITVCANETIVTLLLNFVAILLVEYLVHGPWRDPASFSWPYSAPFGSQSLLPTFGQTRIHVGLLAGLALVLALAWLRGNTTWGFAIRLIGENPKAASLAQIRVGWYLFFTLAIGGAIAAVAGMAEVSAIQGRLRPEISPGYGYNGFLVAWLAGHRPLRLVVVSLAVGALLVGMDGLQVTLNLPASFVSMVLGLAFLAYLAGDRQRATWRSV